MSGPDADRAKLVADLGAFQRRMSWDFTAADNDMLQAARHLLEAFPDRLREARDAERDLIAGYIHAHFLPGMADAIEANAHRPAEGAEPPATSLHKGKVTPSPAGSSPEPTEAEVEAAAKARWRFTDRSERGDNFDDLPLAVRTHQLDATRQALRAAYALRSTPHPAEAPSDGFTAEAPVGTTAQTMAGDYERINGTSAKPRFSSINPPLSEEPQRAAAQRQRFMEAAAPGMRAAEALVGDKDRAELQPGWLKRDIERAGLRIEQWAAMSDGQRITHLEAAHERDGQTIADLRRELAQLQDELTEVLHPDFGTVSFHQHGEAEQKSRADKAEATLVSIRSQVEAETTERIVAWLRDGEVAGWSHATAIARGDHLKATQLPPTGATGETT